METKKFIKNKTVRRIILFIVLIVCAASVFLMDLFVFYPKRQLTRLLTDFEQAARNNDIPQLKIIFSKKSGVYEDLESSQIKNIFDKFEPGIEVIEARYTPNLFNSGDSDWIWGSAKMKMKADASYMEIGEIWLVKEKGDWKIRQFCFTDALQYY